MAYGKVFPYPYWAGQKHLPFKNILTLNADGTATYTSPDETREYTWKETHYGVFLDGKSDLKLTDDNGILKTRVFGFVTLNFEKQ